MQFTCRNTFNHSLSTVNDNATTTVHRFLPYPSMYVRSALLWIRKGMIDREWQRWEAQLTAIESRELVNNDYCYYVFWEASVSWKKFIICLQPERSGMGLPLTARTHHAVTGNRDPEGWIAVKLLVVLLNQAWWERMGFAPLTFIRWQV